MPYFNIKTATWTKGRKLNGSGELQNFNTPRVEMTQDPPCFSKPITIQGESFQRGQINKLIV